MKVIGLDLSLTRPGIALAQPPQPPEGRMILVPTGMRGAERLVLIGHAVRDAIWQAQPDLVAIEGYSYGSEMQAHAIGELGGVVRYLLRVSNIPYEVIPVAQWRRQLFGRNVRKDEVAKEAYKRYGIEFGELDVLEAWCVATAVLRLREGLDKPPTSRKAKARPGGARVGSAVT